MYNAHDDNFEATEKQPQLGVVSSSVMLLVGEISPSFDSLKLAFQNRPSKPQPTLTRKTKTG